MEEEHNYFEKMEPITVDLEVLGGKPVIRGTRIPVYLILDLLAKGYGAKDIIKEYPALKEEDIAAAVEYASNVIKGKESVEIEA